MGAWIALSAIAVVTAIIVSLGILVYRGRRVDAGQDQTVEDGFSPAQYQPMLRLLGREDLEFLRQQADCGAQIASEWNRDKQRIFRMYLRELSADFRRLHRHARLLVIESPERDPALMDLLIRQQVQFWRAMVVVELRLALSHVGLAGNVGLTQLDARRLIDSMQAMHAEVTRRSSAASA